MPWQLVETDILDAGGTVYVVPLGQRPYRPGSTVLGWVQRLRKNHHAQWRRYDETSSAPLLPDDQAAVLDLIEHRAYEETIDWPPKAESPR